MKRLTHELPKKNSKPLIQQSKKISSAIQNLRAHNKAKTKQKKKEKRLSKITAK